MRYRGYILYASVLLILAAIVLPVGTGQGWLGEGRPDYNQIRSYFTDPIFYPSYSGYADSSRSYYYPYFGADFFREPYLRSPYRPLIRLGSGIGIQAEDARQSEFRNQSLAGMDWPARQNNWTATMEFVKTRSSLRIYDHGAWRSV
ncbi:MAG TPA: hypothetical protein PLI05_11170 [Methanotrichaceae archaeon]|nr:hypothetical protein [Methanotrichaceae archaeon]HQI92190.1 hypothetical protein [Methanotrichaceae archaeon]HQJ29345.1 hypothetical protein [Methanotrichaceae archaeon]